MRQLATYCISASFTDTSAADARRQEVVMAIEKWLTSKGAQHPLESEGFFHSKTKQDDTGIYLIAEHTDEHANLLDFTLEEKSSSGLDFRTDISILRCECDVSVYSTLSVSNPKDAIADAFADARCPAVVRELLTTHSDWTYADNPIPVTVESVDTPTEVDALVERLCNPEARKLPLVLVSEFDGEEAWPNIAQHLGRDLVGAAEVFRIREGASLLLSEKIGKRNSCYLGAIRLYWPATSAEQMPRSHVWTEESLLPHDEELDDLYAKRFRTKIRNLILSATAVSVSAPKKIRELREGSAARALNDKLQSSAERITSLETSVSDLTAKLEDSEHQIRLLTHKLQQATAVNDITEAAAASNDDEDQPPRKGETRFYKKIANAGKADKMAQTNDCGHATWQSSHGAHKARKGLIRLLKNQEWKSLHHCGTCTGGGVWKVEF